MDITIEFDNAHGVFVPGFEVSGCVIFTVTEHPLKARAVIISVDGRASTHWTVSERHSRQTQTTHRTITYSAHVPYATGEAVVWSPPPGESAGHLTLGTHRFPFRFYLSPNCPPSFEGMNGFIRYFCKAKIDRPWKFDHTTRRVFTVVPTFDLNQIPSAASSICVQTNRDIGVFLFKHGKISVTARTSKGGYVPGESIVMQAEVMNASSRVINKIELKLVELSRYIAHRNGFTYLNANICGAAFNKNGQTRMSKRTVTSFEEKINLDKGKSMQYSRMVPIPPIVPSFKTCPIIQVEYYLKLKVSTKGAMGNTLSTSLPVVIGTIPIRQFNSTSHQLPAGGISSQVPMGTTPSEMDVSAPSYQPLQPSGNSEMDPPPSYEECVFGKGTIKDEEENKDFAPRYVYYANIQHMGDSANSSFT